MPQAIERRQAAGALLGADLVRDRLNRIFTAAQMTKARSRLLQLRGVPTSYIKRLQHEYIISGRTDFSEKLGSLLTLLPPPGPATLAVLLAH